MKLQQLYFIVTLIFMNTLVQFSVGLINGTHNDMNTLGDRITNV